ncbi:MAG TPA: prenyltransferase/squalene oxidase repeat-containing protein [Lacipirellulaceae bacterium]|nr:prenyltransferase/squalene oxidase repeat-containing protein [Lacipirellulaceae bacterium]
MNLEVDAERLLLAHKTVRAELLAERTPEGHWVGRLASSPLATATAISALVVAHRRDTEVALRDSSAGDGQAVEQIVQRDLCELFLDSVNWLARLQNADGGWGDCDRARSNIAATLLVRAAFRLTGIPAKYADLMVRADDYVEAQGGVGGLWRQFGNDKTFVTAILANCALAGMVPWQKVPTLPFELVCLPKRWLRHFPPPVARNSVPIFLAVGRAKQHHDPTHNPLTRIARRALRGKTLTLLNNLQAEDGSFTASVPTTAFVVMSLAGCGCQDHPVVARGVEFLLASIRADSSWAVENQRAAWNTALAVHHLVEDVAATTADKVLDELPAAHSTPAFGHAWEDTAHVGGAFVETTAADTAGESHPSNAGDVAPRDDLVLDERCLNWLLDRQHGEPNPLTEVPAGGWSWSDSPGALPNTTATSAALMALAHWRRRFAQLHVERIDRAATLAITWLLDVQNDDGGWSTFYRDSSAFQFDTSASDTTAHALRALAGWSRLRQFVPVKSAREKEPFGEGKSIAAVIERGLGYLESQQRDDGSFVPTWFGNEYHEDESNPVYGTADVLMACAELGRLEGEMALRAVRWLASAQHSDGGWGPPRAPMDYSSAEKDGFRAWRANESLAKFASVEETAMATSALLPLATTHHAAGRAVSSGLAWLSAAVEQDAHRQGAVVGFYPGRLWYHERLYPLVFAARALSLAVRQLEPQRQTAAHTS